MTLAYADRELSEAKRACGRVSWSMVDPTGPTCHSARLIKNSTLGVIVGIAAACLLCQAGLSIAQQPQQAPVFVGVLRADGLLVPIAIHDGMDWWNRWPFSPASDESIERLVLPSSIGRIPADWLPLGVHLPDEWRVQLDTGRNISIRLGSPAHPRGFT